MSDDDEPFIVTVGDTFIVLGLGCLGHALIWLALRDPSVAVDPFVGAEGLIACAVLLVGLGIWRRSADRHSNAEDNIKLEN